MQVIFKHALERESSQVNRSKQLEDVRDVGDIEHESQMSHNFQMPGLIWSTKKLEMFDLKSYFFTWKRIKLIGDI